MNDRAGDVMDFFNRWAGTVLAGLTVALVINGVIAYGLLQRMDERITDQEDFQQQQTVVNKQVSDTLTALSGQVAVLKDRDNRRGGG